MTGAVALPVYAAPGVEAQIDAAVATYIESRVQQEALRRNWRGVRVAQRIERIGSVTGLMPCADEPRVRPGAEVGDIHERKRLDVVCPTDAGWTVAVMVQPTVMLPAVHAAGIIERGQTLGPEHLVLEPINIGKAHRGYYHQPEELIGRAAKRRIRANQLLTPALLTEAPAVRRGQPVKIIASNEGIEASANGEALADGQPGDVIRVRNLASRKMIDAQVVEPGVVTSTY
ncbi:flagellar basal body P-ring formation chaperone FlgA [Pseudomonas sp. Marseille-QA0892]